MSLNIISDDVFDHIIDQLSVKDIQNLSSSCKELNEKFKYTLLYKKNLFLEQQIKEHENTLSKIKIILNNYTCSNCQKKIQLYPLYFWSNKLEF